MPNQRGQSGFVALHGYLFPGTPLVDGAVSAGATFFHVGVAPGDSLYGVIAAGDTFTVDGVSGTYTVTNQTPHIAQSDQVRYVGFTPEAPVGGFPDGAVLTFATPLVAQVRTWNLETTLTALDATCMQDAWRTYVPGIGNWTARLGLLLDYDDPGQAAIIDAINAEIPAGILATVTLGATDTDGMDLATFRPHVLCEMGQVTSVEVVGATTELVAVVVQCTRSQGWTVTLATIAGTPAWVEEWDDGIVLPTVALWSEAWDVLLPPTTSLWTEDWETTVVPPTTSLWTETWES